MSVVYIHTTLLKLPENANLTKIFKLHTVIYYKFNYKVILHNNHNVITLE